MMLVNIVITAYNAYQFYLYKNNISLLLTAFGIVVTIKGLI
jgi:hypothetical protein